MTDAALPQYQSGEERSQGSSSHNDEKVSPSTTDEIQVAPPGLTTGGIVTEEQYVSEAQLQARSGSLPFRWQSLWEPAVINSVNGKSFTFPIFRIWDPYSIAFWLATLGFFSAFFSWFAFSPLMPEAVKSDLKLTQAQITHSNLASLGGTAIVRIFAGAAVDRFGPRKVMAFLLCLGAIPSALVPLVSNIGHLEAVRFFISILGGTFVPTQAWTTTFFDKTIVGTANAFSGGWGNMGGGVTVFVMINIFEGLRKAGLTPHLAWRICFLVLPVPLLFVVAALMMLVGKDHPAGKWSQRHLLPGTAIAVAHAVSEPLTLKSAAAILSDLRVWMCALSYMMTFGLETALDAALPGLILTLFQSPSFGPVDAAYVASTWGLCNLYARPFGGILCDILYRRFRHRGLGVRAKVIFLLATGISQGLLLVGLGIYVDHGKASLGGVIGFIVAIATVGFAANGAAYAVYGHLRPKNVGVVAGIIGSCGNVGGLWFTLIFLYQPGSKALRTLGRKFWISGIVNAALLVPFVFLPLGDAN
ncbi:MFS general substrate transporter [Meira miltonrushii]|uniref:MFS general substrate transporter n=1 Tax=Meira miltonrushii TaxID=1280837 RepID=A0A316VJK3_9BASI|nr:MFS general substrate transporter [Meira miltonrushii]PWN37680.1 MFS general substrate transporter [Meira miltonrushii]